MSIAASLLTRGYFPRELPPPFTTEPFGKFIAVQSNRLLLPSQTKPWTRCVSHNLARPGSLRRPLKIPNPIHHLPLAEEIEKHWLDLTTHFRKSRFSFSRPMIRRSIKDRAIVPKYSHRILSRLRARKFVGARYFLRTDINQFYPTIYTHSVPWAIHSKAVAKANFHTPSSGNLIDTALRNQQDGQTIGIPIGPDTSLVIAEAILTSIDIHLTPLQSRGFRHVDDYEIGFSTLAEAEETLTQLQGQLADLELYLNPRKTKITEGPIAYDEEWAVELGRFSIRDNTPTKLLNDATALFSRSFELSKLFPGQAVLRYAIARAKGFSFPGAGWRTFQALLFNAVTADAGAFPTMMVLIEKHLSMGQAINKTAFGCLIESVISKHAPLGHGSEVAWGLWASIQFDIGMSKEIAELVSKMEDDVVALLALDANSRGIFPTGALDISGWQSLVSLSDALSEEHWLLAYESNRKKWLQCPTVKKHAFFKILEKNEIEFYNPKRRLTEFEGPAGSVPGGGSVSLDFP